MARHRQNIESGLKDDVGFVPMYIAKRYNHSQKLFPIMSLILKP